MAHQQETVGVHRESDADLHRAQAIGHEPVAVSVRGLVIGIVALLAFLIGSMILLYVMVGGIARWAHDETVERSPVQRHGDRIAMPHVEPNQAFVTAEQRMANQRHLAKFGWISRDAGIARIPIDRAMQLYAEELTAKQPSEESTAPRLAPEDTGRRPQDRPEAQPAPSPSAMEQPE